ncbi:hypothetical protein CANMA_001036 [Candida margitis]|uniref:uncharacterized protein n=1 Tax=Candida margitis TaxID=1775924 RepID=UPI002226939A|nr:uncharacterized protein CANMA_001036 [Candida margitis]KAI5969996.1 hypothetical protein CANMA_001036 [Candida margitis]
MLVSPENFGTVEPGVYRCSKLEVENFQFLETLNLKSIILLDAENPPRSLSKFLEENKIDLYSLGDLKISNHQHTGMSSKTDLEDYTVDNDDLTSNTSTRSSTSASTQLQQQQRQQQQSQQSYIDPLTPIPILSRNSRDQWMLIEKNIIVKSFEIILNNKRHPILIVDSTATLIGILRKIQKWNFNSILNEYRIFNGTSTKNNYFAETFLELISIELIPYENRKKSPFGSRRNSMRRKSLGQHQAQQMLKNQAGDDSPILAQAQSKLSSGPSSGAHSTDEDDSVLVDGNDDGDYNEDDIEGEDDYDEGYSTDDLDDMDDDLLSASPQIPENLLKFVEQRKQDKQNQFPTSGRNSIDNKSDTESASTSPRLMRIPIQHSRTNSGSNSRSNSFTNADSYLSTVRGMDRRKSSGDIIKNIKFRNPQQQFPHRTSLESSSPVLKRRDSKQCSGSFYMNDDGNNPKPVEFMYYKNINKYDVKFENVRMIKFKLPAEHRLPKWFIKGRDMWEANYKLLNKEVV